MIRFHLASVLLGGLALTACSASSPTPPTAGTGSAAGDQALRARLNSCAAVTNSSDPAASACLAGTYVGRTLSNETCSLTVRANGSYDYSAPSLSYTYTPTARTIRVFGHQVTGSDHQVIWLISDPIQVEDAYDLDFHALYGPNVDTLGKKLEIQAEKTLSSGGRVSSTCLVTI